MLPASSISFACTNIEVNAVCQVAGCANAEPITPCAPVHRMAWENPAAARSQWLERCVNS